MTRARPLYHAIATELPRSYRHDRISWRQVQDYLALPDALCRSYLNQLLEITSWLSPAAADMMPPGDLGEGDAIDRLARQNTVLDEVLGWADFEVPRHDIWELKLARIKDVFACHQLVRRKAELLCLLPKLMRERHAPAGFLRLVCACFALDTDEVQCPVLLEHHLFHGAGPGEGETRDGSPWRVTLLLPEGEAFATWSRFEQARTWILRNTPAHVRLDVYLVTRSYWRTLVDDRLEAGGDLRSILGDIRSHVVLREAVHLGADEQGPMDLGLGRLPGPTGEPSAGDADD